MAELLFEIVSAVAQLLFEFIFQVLFEAALRVPGWCISALIGQSPKEIGDAEAVCLSAAFWGVVITLCWSVWALFSWFTAVAV